MSTLDELKIDTDESQLNNKTGMKKIRSPGHILDDQLYVEWHENDNDISDGSLSKKSIQTHFEISKSKTSTIDCENGIFCVSYSPNEKYLAVGCQDGGIRVLTTKDGKLGYRLKTKGNLPVCSMKWRQSKDNGLTNTLVSVNSYGYINHWQIETQKSIHSIQEKNNHIFCVCTYIFIYIFDVMGVSIFIMGLYIFIVRIFTKWESFCNCGQRSKSKNI